MRQNEGPEANASFNTSCCYSEAEVQARPLMLFRYAVQCLASSDINTRLTEKHSYIQSCYSVGSKTLHNKQHREYFIIRSRGMLGQSKNS
jgi:hypothetical protein